MPFNYAMGDQLFCNDIYMQCNAVVDYSASLFLIRGDYVFKISFA